MNEYNWEKINYLSEKDDWKIKTTIAFNVLYAKREKTYLAYFPKQLKLWKTSYLFNDFKQKRMTLYCRKILFALLRGIMWKYHRDFHCLNCLHYFATKNKSESR